MPTRQDTGQSGGRTDHPERFDPDQSANTLMDSEHRGRYCWAAQLVGGKSVLDAGCGTGYGLALLAEGDPTELTAIDIDDGAVAAARRYADRHGASVACGDLQALEFDDDSFDLAVCFETIEHLPSPERGVAELRRVVRPGGTLIVSSPNPDVYPSGNEHHLHELRPDELRELVGKHFESTRVFLQHAWLASTIEPVDRNGDAGGEDSVRMRRARRLLANGTTFSIVVGNDDEPPDTASLISLGDPFEVRWWEQRVSEAGAQADLAVTRDGSERAAATEERARTAEAKLAEQELEAARGRHEAAAREASLSKRLQEASKALVDANQELAETPVLKHRLAELYEQNAALQAQLHDVLNSRSWHLTGFLRRMRAALRPRR